MANFRVASSGIIPRLVQTISTSSGNSRLIECTSISRSANAPSKASFVMPSAYFDEARDDLRDSYVQVRIANGNDYQFGGYIDVDNATGAPGGEQVSFSATSPTGWLNKVWVGQTAYAPNVDYRFRDKIGNPTGLTPAMVLQDIFLRMPPKWQSRVVLGDISELNRAVSIHLPPTISLKLATFQQAISTLSAYFGDLCWAERFEQDKVIIDFYRIGGATRGTYTATCANYGNPAGANIQEITHSQSATDTVNRVIVYGARRKFIISATTTPIPTHPMMVLQPVWHPQLEASVLQNPNVADPRHKDYIVGGEHVFRRLRLPAAITSLPGVQISKDLGIFRVVDGEKQVLGVQVWKFPTILEPDPEDDSKAIGVVQTTPKLISGVNLELDKFTFTITNFEEAMNVVSLELNDKGIPVKTYARATIGITFAFEPADYLVGDTGASATSGVDIDLMEDGFTEVIPRPDFEYTQYTNIDFPLSYGETSDIVFTTRIFDEAVPPPAPADPEDPEAPPPTGGTWFEISTKTVVHDDSAVCAYLAGQMLRTRNVRARELSVSLPYADPAAKVGQLVRVNGIEVAPDNYVTSSVSWDLVGNNTNIMADNAMPPTRFEVAVNNGYDATGHGEQE